MGESGSTPQTGEHSSAIPANPGDVWAPRPVAPVHETAIVRLPKGLPALKPGANAVGLDLKGASLNREGGVDATRPRTCIGTAGMSPNSTDTPRQRKTTKRGRKRWFKDAIQA